MQVLKTRVYFSLSNMKTSSRKKQMYQYVHRKQGLEECAGSYYLQLFLRCTKRGLGFERHPLFSTPFVLLKKLIYFQLLLFLQKLI